MSEQQPNQSPSNARVIGFIVILSFICALVLSILSSALEEPQMIARDLDRSKQMMMAARIMNHEGGFQILDEAGKYVPATMSSGGYLVAADTLQVADRAEIIEVYRKRFRAALMNEKGEIISFKDAGIDPDEYIKSYRKTGYYKQPNKLIYEILPNEEGEGKDVKPIGYVIPVNGYGLWDAIYGYIAVEPDGNSVIGISWYDQKETPGLGANIAEAYWQNLFPGKHIYQSSPDGSVDFKASPIGIQVVRGKVAEVFGDSPKAQSAVDGMAGATLTGNGVTAAYKDVLTAYRPLFLRLHEENGNKKSSNGA